MKTSIIISTLLFCIYSCTSKPKEQLTKQEEEQIKKEIIATIDSLWTGFNNFDVEGALKFYSPIFVAYGDDGKSSLEQLRKYYLDIYPTTTLFKWTSHNIDFLSITKEKVILTQEGKMEYARKSGEKGILDPVHYTFGFEKKPNGWKLFYEHYSIITSK
jgi:hypothetical protein